MEDQRHNSARWRWGSIVAVVALVVFVVLSALVVVGMFMRSAMLVGLFPWALAGLLVAIVGMTLARSVKSPDDLAELAAEKGAQAH